MTLSRRTPARPPARKPQDRTAQRFARGLDEFWQAEVAPRVIRLVALDAETSRYLKQRYRRLCRRAGFQQLKRSHPRDAVQWYLDSVPGLTWTRR